MYTYGLMHVDVWQKPTQHYKVINLQLKINEFKKCLNQKKKFPHKLFNAKVVDLFLSPLSYSIQST